MNCCTLACIPGYHGKNCTIVCPYPSYGPGCQDFCDCKKDMCDVSTGCTQKTTGRKIACRAYGLMNLKWNKLLYKEIDWISLLVFAVDKISSVKTTIIESNDCNRDCDENMSDVSTGYTQITTGKNSV